MENLLEQGRDADRRIPQVERERVRQGSRQRAWRRWKRDKKGARVCLDPLSFSNKGAVPYTPVAVNRCDYSRELESTETRFSLTGKNLDLLWIFVKIFAHDCE